MSDTTEFTIGSSVPSGDGVCGDLSRVVVGPVARTLTQLVVDPRHGQKIGRLVPVDLFESTEQTILLKAGSRAHASISKLVREATCPVIAPPDVERPPAFIHEAARRGVLASSTNGDANDDQFGARSPSCCTEPAFAMRDRSRPTSRRLIEIARTVLDAHSMLPDKTEAGE